MSVKKLDDPIRVLIVEDDNENGPATEIMLKSRGFEVDLVTSGEEALERFSAEVHDVILADIRLTGMSGVELLRVIRETYRGFPFILITGYDSLDSAIDAVKLNADDYILKPTSGIDDVILPIQKAVKTARLAALAEELQRDVNQLGTDLTLAEERERRVVAEDLHDVLGQSLVSCNMRLRRALTTVEDPSLRVALTEVADEIAGAIGQVRTMVFDLSPMELNDLGLVAALRGLLDRSNLLHPFETKLTTQGDDECIPDTVRILLYRSARELLCNICKHAEATRVDVSVLVTASTALITVRDNGMGFELPESDSQVSRRNGFGLFSIRTRLETVGGTMHIKTRRGKGCTITLRIPLTDTGASLPGLAV